MNAIPRCLLALACAGWVPFVAADVFRYGPTADESGQQVENLSTGSAANGGPAALIASNAVAVDAASNRLFFAQPSGTGTQIRFLNYGATSEPSNLLTVPDQRITHLEFDAAPAPRLLALAIRNSDDQRVLTPILIDSLTIGTAMPITGDLVTGVSAFRASDDRLFAVSRSGTSQNLLSIDANAGTQIALAVPNGSRIVELSMHPSSGLLFGLVDQEGDQSTYVSLLGVGASLSIDLRGTADTDCCFILAGPSAIDSSANRLYALTRPRSGTAPVLPVVTSFDLNTGGRSLEGFARANALFADSGVALPELFSDGFE